MTTRQRIASLAGPVALAAMFLANPMAALAHPAPAHTEADKLVDAANHAADHAAHVELSPMPAFNEGVTTGITAVVVFLIVAVVLLTMVWPKIAKGLDDRNAKIREEIEAAEMARKQAKDALEQYQASLAQARAEAQKMLDQTRAQQAVMAEELKKKADVELSQMREKAMRDIESAKKAAVGEIYTQAAELAGAMAGKILRKNISVDDQSRLIEETVTQMNAPRNN